MFWVFLEAQEEVKDAMVFKTSLREVLYSKCFLTKATSELLVDPGEARGLLYKHLCDSFIKSFMQ